MKTLFIGSTRSYCGKTMIALGLAKRFQVDGLKVGYMKPLGKYPTTVEGMVVDADAVLIYDVLGMDEPLELISPTIITQDIIARAYNGEDLQLGEKIVQAHKEISHSKDLVIVEGAGSLSEGSLFGIPAKQLINCLDADVILVSDCSEETFVDDLLCAQETLETNIVGVVLNRVHMPKADDIRNRIVPFLTQNGLHVLGLLLHTPILMSVSIGELAETLSGEILCCHHRLDSLVEQFSVGAMSAESALSHFRKMRSKAVITGGDRADVQLAALRTDTACLILTGNLYPNDIIIARAEERDVPIIVVPDHTFTVVQKVEDMISRLRIQDKRRVDWAIQLVDEELDFQSLYDRLEISKE